MSICDFFNTEIINVCHVLLDFTFFELRNGNLSVVFSDKGDELFVFLNVFVTIFNILIEFDN